MAESFQSHLDKLGNNQSFLAFLNHVHSLREQEIKLLRNAARDDVMRVAGRVDAMDEVLSLGGYEGLLERYERIVG